MKAAIELFRKTVKAGAGVLLLVERLEDEGEAQKRLSVCEQNAGKCFNAESRQCMECGCYMDVKTKMLKHRNAKAGMRVEVTHCPLAKWGGKKELEIVNYYRELDGKKKL